MWVKQKQGDIEVSITINSPKTRLSQYIGCSPRALCLVPSGPAAGAADGDAPAEQPGGAHVHPDLRDAGPLQQPPGGAQEGLLHVPQGRREQQEQVGDRLGNLEDLAVAVIKVF